MDKESRIERANRALREYESDDIGDAPFIDLIADLLISAADDGHDVDAIMRCARFHFDAEF